MIKIVALTRPRQTVINCGFGKYNGMSEFEGKVKILYIICWLVCACYPAANGPISVWAENSKRAQKQVALINGSTFGQNPGFGKM